jgi:hypothetical protein
MSVCEFKGSGHCGPFVALIACNKGIISCITSGRIVHLHAISTHHSRTGIRNGRPDVVAGRRHGKAAAGKLHTEDVSQKNKLCVMRRCVRHFRHLFSIHAALVSHKSHQAGRSWLIVPAQLRQDVPSSWTRLPTPACISSVHSLISTLAQPSSFRLHPCAFLHHTLHSSLCIKPTTELPRLSQEPCAIKTGTSFSTRRAATCRSRSSRQRAMLCRRTVVVEP